MFEEIIKDAIGEKGYEKVRSVKIGIAGCGGLGSNCAFNLVRAGFRKFIIADHDQIELSNLNRQFYFFDQVGRRKTEVLRENLLRINPDLEIEVCGRVEEENVLETFSDCEVIVEAFDTPEYKSMIVGKMIPTGKLIVTASGLCGVGKSDDIKVHRLRENLIMIGDLQTSSECVAPISPRVNIAAAKQANVILEWVLK